MLKGVLQAAESQEVFHHQLDGLSLGWAEFLELVQHLEQFWILTAFYGTRVPGLQFLDRDAQHRGQLLHGLSSGTCLIVLPADEVAWVEPKPLRKIFLLPLFLHP